MRILFTGGSGKAGKHCVDYLLAQGHKILNLDQVDLNHPEVLTRFADITDAGQVYDVMSSYAHYDELESGQGVPKFDAVVHFAAIPRLLFKSDNECYRVNTVGTYNVIDAAIKLGVKKVIFASSETTYGICFADGELKPDYLPIDEEHPTIPEDSYAMSKVVNEVTARSFHQRSGIDIYGLRINNVIEPHEYSENFPSNDDHSVHCTSEDLIETYYQGVPIKGDEIPQSFYTNAKAKRLLGYQPAHSWRDYVSP